MRRYVLFSAFGAIATFVLLFRRAKELNASVPTDVLIGTILSSFAVYLILVGSVIYFVSAKVKWVALRLGIVMLFFIGFYYAFWTGGWPHIDGYAP